MSDKRYEDPFLDALHSVAQNSLKNDENLFKLTNLLIDTMKIMEDRIHTLEHHVLELVRAARQSNKSVH